MFWHKTGTPQFRCVYRIYIKLKYKLTNIGNMAKFMLDIPEELHDKLRHESVDTKKDIHNIIIELIYNWNKQKR